MQLCHTLTHPLLYMLLGGAVAIDHHTITSLKLSIEHCSGAVILVYRPSTTSKVNLPSRKPRKLLDRSWCRNSGGIFPLPFWTPFVISKSVGFTGNYERKDFQGNRQREHSAERQSIIRRRIIRTQQLPSAIAKAISQHNTLNHINTQSSNYRSPRFVPPIIPNPITRFRSPKRIRACDSARSGH